MLRVLLALLGEGSNAPELINWTVLFAACGVFTAAIFELEVEHLFEGLTGVLVLLGLLSGLFDEMIILLSKRFD